MENKKVLVVESDSAFQEALEAFFEHHGGAISIKALTKGAGMEELLDHEGEIAAVVVASRVNSREMNTLSLINYIRQMYPRMIIIGKSSREDYREIMVSAGCDVACDPMDLVKTVYEKLGLSMKDKSTQA